MPSGEARNAVCHVALHGRQLTVAQEVKHEHKDRAVGVDKVLIPTVGERSGVGAGAPLEQLPPPRPRGLAAKPLEKFTALPSTFQQRCQRGVELRPAHIEPHNDSV